MAAIGWKWFDRDPDARWFDPASQRADLLLTPEGGGTKVTWTMNGNMGSNPLFRWMALFGDKMVGPDFEAGLANLKQHVTEAAA
mgnify:CR=1 FL=1